VQICRRHQIAEAYHLSIAPSQTNDPRISRKRYMGIEARSCDVTTNRLQILPCRATSVVDDVEYQLIDL
jgi:hypothetical protein